MPKYSVEGEGEALLCRLQKYVKSESGVRVSKTEILNAILQIASGQESDDTGPSEFVSFYELALKSRLEPTVRDVAISVTDTVPLSPRPRS